MLNIPNGCVVSSVHMGWELQQCVLPSITSTIIHLYWQRPSSQNVSTRPHSLKVLTFCFGDSHCGHPVPYARRQVFSNNSFFFFSHCFDTASQQTVQEEGYRALCAKESRRPSSAHCVHSKFLKRPRQNAAFLQGLSMETPKHELSHTSPHNTVQ